jgi:hypothetical protein
MSKNSSAALAAEKQETKIVSLNAGKPEQEEQEVKNLSIEEVKNRAITLALLNRKHDDLTEKRKRLEQFAIVHDRNNAQINVTDANGEEFVSNSPKSIRKLVEFWQDEFREAIAENEEQMKKMFA